MDAQRDLARWGWPRPFSPRLPAGLNYLVHRLLVPNRFNRMLGRVVERFPRLRQIFTGAEKVVKEAGFGCRMCGTSSWLNYWQGRDDGLYGVVDVEVGPWPARSAL